MSIIHRRPSEAGMYFIAFFCTLNSVGIHRPISLPPRMSSPVAPPCPSLIIPLAQHLFECCVFFQWWPSKANTPFLLPIFDGAICHSCVHAKNTTTDSSAANPISGRLAWTNRKPWRYDLVVLLTCPWEREGILITWSRAVSIVLMVVGVICNVSN